MSTTTARYGLFKPALTDNVDIVADFNNNYDAIDLKLGSQVCTSSTRPASPVQGMQIYETDTTFTRVYKGSAWTTVGNAAALSSALPANPIVGDTVYLTDIGAVAYYSGSAWHYDTTIAVSSASRPTGSALQIGTVIYETDTKRFLVYNGSSWDNKAFSNFVCTSSTHPSSPFQGLEIYETDTGLSAVYNGSSYSYGLTQIAPTQVLAATAASVTFSAIPAVNNLVLKWRVKGTSTVGDLEMRVDGSSTAANYISAKVTGRGAAATSTLISPGTDTYLPIGITPSSTTASYFGSGSCEIAGWGAATGFMSYSAISGVFDTAASYWAETYAGQYLVVGPHTSLTLLPPAGSFAIGSSFSLYGAP